MFFWCCAEDADKLSKVGTPVGTLQDDTEAVVKADAEEGPYKDSVAQISALPILPDLPVDGAQEEFLPGDLPTISEEKPMAQASPTAVDSSEVTSASVTLAKATFAKSSSGRRTRLELQAKDAHWKVQSSELKINTELSRTLKSTLHLATWKGTEVVMKCVQIPEEQVAVTRSGKRPSTSSKQSITASRPMQGREVDQALLEELLQEIELLSSLRHPDLVLFMGACLDKDAPVMCITEYMPGGDLERYYMAKRKQYQTDRWRPPLNQVIDWCAAVARALSFLHSRDMEPIVHRDLKPLNLLLTKHLEVKVADLGISKMMAAVATDVYKMTGGVGSWLYMAPEVVRHQTYNEKVDIYAFALIMFFMSAGKAPFYQMGKDHELVLKEYLKGNEPRPTEVDCHAQLRPIMKSAWAVDQRDRPSAQTLVERFNEVRENGATAASCFCRPNDF